MKDKIKEQSRAAASKPEPEQTGPQGPEMDVEAKRTAALSKAASPIAAAVIDRAEQSGIEERDCEMCGSKIAVPVGDPPGGICESCANS